MYAKQLDISLFAHFANTPYQQVSLLPYTWSYDDVGSFKLTVKKVSYKNFFSS